MLPVIASTFTAQDAAEALSGGVRVEAAVTLKQFFNLGSKK